MSDLLEKTKNNRKDFTATGYVVNLDRTKILVVFHNKMQKWLPAGGHMEPNEIPHEAALREVFEETGVRARIISDDYDLKITSGNEVQIPRPYAILYELIPESSKDVEHIHVDFIFAMEAEEKELKANLEEVSGARWMTKTQILNADCLESVIGFINNFLN